MSEQPQDPDLWDRCMAEAQATFSLAAASAGVDVRSAFEKALIDMALTAGVGGALHALGHTPPNAKP